MKKETFIIHAADWENLTELDDTQLGVLFRALMMNQREEELPKMDRATKMAFKFMAAQIERDNEKYNAIVEKRRAAAQKRWNKGDDMQMHNLQSHSVSDSDSVSVSVSVSDSERYVSLPDLSPRDEASLRQVAGDRADALIEDVQRYYSTHPEKRFPGWPVALAQFDSNQRRWGRGTAKPQKSIDEIAAEAFKGMEEVI